LWFSSFFEKPFVSRVKRLMFILIVRFRASTNDVEIWRPSGPHDNARIGGARCLCGFSQRVRAAFLADLAASFRGELGRTRIAPLGSLRVHRRILGRIARGQVHDAPGELVLVERACRPLSHVGS
jgi:hypothetical protein